MITLLRTPRVSVILFITAFSFVFSLLPSFVFAQTSSDTQLQSNQTVSIQSMPKGSHKYFQFSAPSGSTVSVKITGQQGDADVYVKRGSRPTKRSYGWRGVTSRSNESIIIRRAQADTYVVDVFAYTNTGVTNLTVGVTPSTDAPIVSTTPTPTPTPSPVLCTQDAYVCPSGVTVGRTGSNCTFVCPTTTSDVPTCLARPACLDATPRCLPAEPVGGWCSPTPSTIFKSSRFSLCLSAGGLVDGTPITQENCKNGLPITENITGTGVELRITGTNYCVDTVQGANTNGDPVKVYGCDNSLEQRFTVTTIGTNRTYKSSSNNKCFDAGTAGTQGHKLMLWDCDSSLEQQFVTTVGTGLPVITPPVLQPAPAPTPTPTPVVPPTVMIPSVTTISPTQGGADTVVTITGSNLTNTSRIELYSSGQVSGTITPTSASSQTVKFTIPYAYAANTTPGTYQLRVITPSGPSNLVSFTFVSPAVSTPSPTQSIPIQGGLFPTAPFSNYTNTTVQSCGDYPTISSLNEGSGVTNPCSGNVLGNPIRFGKTTISGKPAFRVAIKSSDPSTASGHGLPDGTPGNPGNGGVQRVDVVPPGSTLSKSTDYWIAWNMYIPANTYGANDWTTLVNIHIGANCCAGNWSTELDHGKLNFVSATEGVSQNRYYLLSNNLADQWVKVVVKTRLSMGNDGYNQVWVNGTQMVSENGPNTNAGGGDYVKQAFYNYAWGDGYGDLSRPEREMFYGGIYIVKDAGYSYNQVAALLGQ